VGATIVLVSKTGGNFNDLKHISNVNMTFKCSGRVVNCLNWDSQQGHPDESSLTRSIEDKGDPDKTRITASLESFTYLITKGIPRSPAIFSNFLKKRDT